jgi:undecaprenyl-phosphate 4-deoxy-4-formamido-L-arabinose transferase
VTQRLGGLLVEHLPRASGESNYTLRRLIRLWLSMFLNFSVMPLRIGTLLGFLMAGAGVLVFINVILQRLFFGAPLGWGSIMAAVVIFSGVQLVTIGIAAEYLGRMYITLNRRPQYLVRNTYQSANESSKVPAANRPVEVETSNAE